MRLLRHHHQPSSPRCIFNVFHPPGSHNQLIDFRGSVEVRIRNHLLSYFSKDTQISFFMFGTTTFSVSFHFRNERGFTLLRLLLPNILKTKKPIRFHKSVWIINYISIINSYPIWMNYNHILLLHSLWTQLILIVCFPFLIFLFNLTF